MSLEQHISEMEEEFNKIEIGNSLRIHLWSDESDFKSEVNLLYPTEIPD